MADFNWDQFQQAPSGYMSQGGPITDPRWTNGTWGGDARSFDPSKAMPNSGISGYGSFGGATGMPLPPIDQSSTTMPMAPPPPMPPALSGNSATGQIGTAGDPQAYFNQLFPGDTLTPDMLTQHEAELKAQGIELVRNAAGVPGKIKLPNGQVVDVIQGAGSGLNRKQWLTGGGAPGGFGTLNQFGQSSGFMAAPFVDPTAQDALNSPGLQFALDEANRMGQNSAAARGTLLNGRTQQALQASNIQNALQGYNSVYNRAFQTFTRNQDAPFQKYLSLGQLGQQAASAS